MVSAYKNFPFKYKGVKKLKNTNAEPINKISFAQCWDSIRIFGIYFDRSSTFYAYCLMLIKNNASIINCVID